MDDSRNDKRRPPPAVFSANPQTELEEKLKRDPDNTDTKIDVGSDESMDASDPPSVVQPGHNEPVPSSSSPEDDDESGSGA